MTLATVRPNTGRILDEQAAILARVYHSSYRWQSYRRLHAAGYCTAEELAEVHARHKALCEAIDVQLTALDDTLTAVEVLSKAAETFTIRGDL